MKENTVRQIKDGFGTVAVVLAAFGTLLLLIVGIVSLTSPAEARSGVLGSSHPIIFGSLCLSAATVILIVSVNRWVKFLLAYSPMRSSAG